MLNLKLSECKYLTGYHDDVCVCVLCRQPVLLGKSRQGWTELKANTPSMRGQCVYVWVIEAGWYSSLLLLFSVLFTKVYSTIKKMPFNMLG